LLENSEVCLLEGNIVVDEYKFLTDRSSTL